MLHMTLGELIDWLVEQDPSKIVPDGYNGAASYRGYYRHVAFSPCCYVTFERMLRDALHALGSTFSGYKGGSYTMGSNTPVWLACYGDATGRPITRSLCEEWAATAISPQMEVASAIDPIDDEFAFDELLADMFDLTEDDLMGGPDVVADTLFKQLGIEYEQALRFTKALLRHVPPTTVAGHEVHAFVSKDDGRVLMEIDVDKARK